MRILITGAAGFLGFHLSQKLLAEGHEVVGVDNLMSGQEKNIADLKTNSKFSFINADIIDLTLAEIKANERYATLNKLFERIYHLACPASPPIYQKNPLHTLDTCFTGSKNILNLALQFKARIFLASTSEIYGDPEVHPQAEAYRGNVNTMGLRSCYDEGKRIMETLGFEYAQKGVEVRVARIFNTYGPRMSPHDGRVLTNFISQALRGESLTIYGDGMQTRSFCYQSDLIRGFLALMESDVKEPVNLGSQYEFTICDMARTIIDKINPKLNFTHVPLPQDDPKVRRPDTRRAKKYLNWETEVSLEIGIEAMIADFRSNM